MTVATIVAGLLPLFWGVGTGSEVMQRIAAPMVGGMISAPLLSLLEAIREGAVLRVRPKAMTVATIVAGLLPLFWGMGTGSEVMQRIAAPMIGGMISAPLLSLLVVPVVYRLMRRPG